MNITYATFFIYTLDIKISITYGSILFNILYILKTNITCTTFFFNIHCILKTNTFVKFILYTLHIKNKHLHLQHLLYNILIIIFS